MFKMITYLHKRIRKSQKLTAEDFPDPVEPTKSMYAFLELLLFFKEARDAINPGCLPYFPNIIELTSSIVFGTFTAGKASQAYN